MKTDIPKQPHKQAIGEKINHNHRKVILEIMEIINWSLESIKTIDY